MQEGAEDFGPVGVELLDDQRYQIDNPVRIANDFIHFREVLALKIIEPTVKELLPKHLPTAVGSTDVQRDCIDTKYVEIAEYHDQPPGREPVKRGVAGGVMVDQQRQLKRIVCVDRIFTKQIRRGREPRTSYVISVSVSNKYKFNSPPMNLKLYADDWGSSFGILLSKFGE